jgi:hypothetical protein
MEEARQPVQRFRMAFQFAIRVDMLNIDSDSGQMPGNQNRAMAFERLFLGAHQRKPVVFHPLPNALDPLPKQLGLCKPLVLNLPVLAAGRVFASGSEFPAQEYISDPTCAQGLFQCFAIELRVDAAVWFGPHVAECRNAMLQEQVYEMIRPVSGVADGEHGLLHGLRQWSLTENRRDKFMASIIVDRPRSRQTHADVDIVQRIVAFVGRFKLGDRNGIGQLQNI